MLRAMGAWMNVRGSWDPNTLPSGLSVSEWLHRGTLGRDHYVKVVEEGVLFPLGNRAALITITERKFQPHPNNSNTKVAYLRQRQFIVVREPERLVGVAGTIQVRSGNRSTKRRLRAARSTPS